MFVCTYIRYVSAKLLQPSINAYNAEFSPLIVKVILFHIPVYISRLITIKPISSTMPGLKRWIKDVLKPHNEYNTKPEQPEIPKHLLFPLYQTDWPQIPMSTDQSQNFVNYGLFRRLPLEIRQQILGEAFSNRTLHIDINFDHPLRTSDTSSLWPWKGKEARDTSQPKQWHWFSCVCRRRSVRASEEGGEHGYSKRAIEPCDDICVPGTLPLGRRPRLPSLEPSLCYPCESPDEGRIGVMGWLQACRQACVKPLSQHFLSANVSEQIPGWDPSPLRNQHFPHCEPFSFPELSTSHSASPPRHHDIPRAPLDLCRTRPLQK